MDRFFGTSPARGAALALALAVVVALGGCATQSTQTSTGSGRATSVAPTPQSPSASGDTAASGNLGTEASPGKTTGTQASPTLQRLVVTNKTVRVETAGVDAAIARIRDLAARDGGDISSMQVSTTTGEPIYPQPLAGGTAAPDSAVPLRALIVVRVPTAGYAAFVADTVKMGRVLFQSESADDVTQQHVDMQARLGNLQSEQARLRQLFARAKNVRDMLAIEQELTRVQGEIESLQAQTSYLEKQAAFATVTIELTEPKPIVAPSGADWGVATALTDSIRAFVSTMNGLIVIVGPLAALLVFVGLPVLLVVWLVRRAIRRRRSRTKDATAETDATAEQQGVVE
jgi:hypothetical protein